MNNGDVAGAGGVSLRGEHLATLVDYLFQEPATPEEGTFLSPGEHAQALGLELGALVGQEPFLLGLSTSPGDDVLDLLGPLDRIGDGLGHHR